MTDAEELLELAKTCADFKGHDLFSSSLISSIEEFVEYKKQLDGKEKALQQMRDELLDLGRINTKAEILREPAPLYGLSLSLNDIVKYAEGLENNEDVKTIQLMLFILFANRGNKDVLTMISNIRPKRRPEITNVFHDNSQNVKFIKKQVNKHGRHNNI